MPAPALHAAASPAGQTAMAAVAVAALVAAAVAAAATRSVAGAGAGPVVEAGTPLCRLTHAAGSIGCCRNGGSCAPPEGEGEGATSQG